MLRVERGGKGRPRRFNPSMIRDIFKRDSGTCVYCGSYAQEIDHVIPFSDGGPTIRSNGVCACKKCNCKRRDHPLDEDMLVRGIFWLSMHGEDISWMDKLEG